MFLAYLILGSALSISATAIFFSIVGLTTIFPGAFWPIIIMGTVLEIGKLVCACWLHHNWKITSRMLRFYLTAAVCILVLITSMGIFGFLSKSHIEQQRDLDQAHSSIAQLNNKIKNEENYISRQEGLISKLEKLDESSSARTDFNIELEQKKIQDLEQSLATSITYDEQEIARANERLQALDGEVEALESKSGGLFSNKKEKLKALKESQEGERTSLSAKKSKAEGNINATRTTTAAAIAAIRQRLVDFQDSGSIEVVADPALAGHEDNIREGFERIDNWESEKFKIESSISDLEVEVGPIKYIAALVEDMGVDNVILAEAVRLVILILVFVFDPLAVAMLLAANSSLRMARSRPYEKLSEQIVQPKKKNSSS